MIYHATPRAARSPARVIHGGPDRLFIIRQSKLDDVATLLRLAKMVYFINLPPNEQIIGGKIEQSEISFGRAAGKAKQPKNQTSRKSASASQYEGSDLFMFSMFDTETGTVIGTSQIRAHQGGPGNPNWAMKITERTFRSEPLSYSSTHKVGKLFGDESGPSEIGGLIIQPSYRGNPQRPGRFLSFVRFHFIGLYRKFFADRILAEMMAPVSTEGENSFWDNFGRKFIPVKYAEADRFCQHNRRFIPELLPREEIYFSLFSLEVQNMVGEVAKETVPARRLLESMGFKYRGMIDPFDGGPHLDAQTDQIDLVKKTRTLPLLAAHSGRLGSHGIVSVLTKEAEFRAVETQFAVEKGGIRLSEEVMSALDVEPGATIGFTPVAPADDAPHHHEPMEKATRNLPPKAGTSSTNKAKGGPAKNAKSKTSAKSSKVKA